jgi:predicted DNA-binding protein
MGKREAVNVRIPKDLLERAGTLKESLERAGLPAPSKSSLVRLALEKGIAALEKQLQPASTGKEKAKRGEQGGKSAP